MRNIKKSKAFTAFLVIVALVIQLVFNPAAVIKSQAEQSHSSSENLTFENTEIASRKSLKDNGDGTYTLRMELGAENSKSDVSEDFSFVKENYFVAPYDGTYLVDLWGGDGADGDSTNAGEGGRGGSGAHLYGTVHLSKGDVLYYTLGGHGQPTTVTDEGGGANGNGGGLGNTVTSSYQIGGGGGYSAVFLFSADGESTGYDVFEANYLDENGELAVDGILEGDRTTRYIMVAGGGGGGGAGNGFILTGIFGGSSNQVGRADGGNAGGFDSAYGEISGTGIVNGTYYAGSDGKSSGTSTAYIGHGGSNVPGELADSITTLIKGAQPNDWFATYNTNHLGGAGGSGDMRGGAGGAGFAGGSGGVMTAIIEANNVGGGGGGSSFVADTITRLSDDEKSQYENAGYINTKNYEQSDGGGQVKITFLQADNEEDVVEQVNVKVPMLSKYFNLVDVKAVDTKGNTVPYTEDGNYYNISNAEVISTSAGDKLTIELTFKPKDGFAGGNDVPVFKDSKPEVSVTQVLENGVGETVKQGLGDGLSFVNIPLDFVINGVSHMTSEENPSYELSELYDDKYADIRNNLSADDNYDFIEEIGEYSVTDADGNVLTQAVQPTETTSYNVSFTVTPKAGGKAVVGDAVEETTYSATSKITILDEGETTLNGTDIKYTKKLEYDETSDRYILSLNVKAGKEALAAVAETKDWQKGSSDDVFQYTIPQSGYYLVQAWGGNGGSGGEASAWGRTYTGGSGGTGGYVYGYVHLEKGDGVSGELAANGSNGTSGRTSGIQANGGEATKVWLGDNPIIVAGGGGGGGNAGTGDWGFSSSSGKNGENSTQIENNYNDSTGVYDGKKGGLAVYESAIFGAYSCEDGGSGGAAGKNYLNTELKTTAGEELTDDAKGIFNDSKDESTSLSSEGGAVRITCLQLDESAETLSNYDVTANISNYFTILPDEITAEGVKVENNSKGFTSTVNGQNVSITAIKPSISVAEEDTNGGKNVSSSIDFTIRIPLKPVDNLVGGYDIPLLNDMTLAQTLDEENSGSVAIEPKEETDFANVDIRYAFDANDLTASDLTIIKDEVSSVEELKALLYSSDLTDGNWIWGDFADSTVTLSPEPTSLPNETTTYQIRVDVEPTKDAPDNAVVKTTVTPVSKTLTATVTVNYSVETLDNSNLTISNGVATTDVDYIGILKADTGYKLPTTIAVKTKTSNETIDNFTYNPKTGEIKIPADAIAAYKDNFVIDAAAESNTFRLYTAYRNLDNQTIINGPVYFEAGTEVNPNEHGDLFRVPAHDETKYTFEWDNEEVQNALSTGGTFTMPGSDLYVIGVFKPVEYDLTVNYVDENGNVLHSPVTAKYGYNTTYSAEAKEISGYALDEVRIGDETVETAVLVEGTMPVGGTSVTFVYKALEGTVKVTYMKQYPENLTPPAGFESLIEEVEEPIIANKEYSIVSPDVPGYTPDKAEITGTADANATGMQYFVYYTPNQYQITFDPQGGTLAANAASKLVQYDLPYSFDATAGDYNHPTVGGGLPTPQKSGYEFAGWYTEEDGKGTKITNSTIVNIDGDPGQEVKLYAYWKAQTFTINVRFVDEDGQELTKSFSYEAAYGDKYDVESYIDDNDVDMPDKADYHKEVVFSENAKGDMPAMNVDVVVTYYYKSYTLEVKYKLQDADGEVHDWFTESQDVRYNKSYRVEKSFETAKDQYGDAWPAGVVQTEGYEAQQLTYIGTMPADDLVINYYYVTDTPVVSVDIEWGDFTYDYTRGTWNPETHQYEGDEVEEADENEHYVKVTNNAESTIKMNVEFNYTCSDRDFEALQPMIALDGGTAKAVNTVRKDNLGVKGEAASTKAVLGFSGLLWQNQNIPNNIPLDTAIPFGVMKVTITGGDPK